MNDLIKDIVREMILNGEIRIGIIEENGLYHIGLEVVEDEVKKQSGRDSVELIDLMRLHGDLGISEDDINFLDNYR